MPTSVHEHAGAPLHSLLDLSDIHISSSKFPALQSLDRLLATLPMEREATLVLLITEVMKSLSQPCLELGAGGEGKRLVSSQHPADGSRCPIFFQHHQVLPHLPQTQHQAELAAGELRGGENQWVRHFVAVQGPTAPLAPSRGVTFCPVEEKLGQVLLQEAAPSPRPKDFPSVQQML